MKVYILKIGEEYYSGTIGIKDTFGKVSSNEITKAPYQSCALRFYSINEAKSASRYLLKNKVYAEIITKIE